MKGPLGALTQILITMGIMIAFFLGIPIPDVFFDSDKDQFYLKEEASFASDNYWRVMFALPIAFSILQCILLLTAFNYETPKFLKQNKQNAQLNELMGKIYESNRVLERIDAIAVESGNGSSAASPGYKETLCHPRYQFATLLGCSLSILQQLSGINAVMFYSSEIFKQINFSPRIGSGLVGFINMASTFGAVLLLGSNVTPI
jgi:hypothetical protein